MARKSPGWFQLRRLDWIRDMLYVYGFINREHLMKKFVISKPQASKDLNLYAKVHPDAMIYNQSTKRYESAGKEE